jgi:MoxR-like ATPase
VVVFRAARLASLALLSALVFSTVALAQEGTEAFSNAETERLEAELAERKQAFDEADARFEEIDNAECCKYDNEDYLNARDVRSEANDAWYATAYELAEARLREIQEAPVPAEDEASEEERIEVLRAKRDALSSLSQWMDYWNMTDAAGPYEAVRNELEKVDGELAQLEGYDDNAGESLGIGEALWGLVSTLVQALLLIGLILAVLAVSVGGLAWGARRFGLRGLGFLAGALFRALRGALGGRRGGGPRPRPDGGPSGPVPAGPTVGGSGPGANGWFDSPSNGHPRGPGSSRSPGRDLSAEARQRLLNLEATLHEKIVGQEEAVSAIASSVRRREAGGFGGERPASFLCMGPTGVGKTEVAKVVADEVYGGEMVRLDMSEYGSEYQVNRMTGAPPGYVGHEAGGQLTDPILENPRRLVLLDEIEKAHEKAWTILLGVLDDGRLTDNRGRTADFGEATVVMTSNLLAEEIRQVYEAGQELDERAIKNELVRRGIKRELVNRIGRIAVFRPLSPEDVREICRRMLSKTVRQMRERHGVELRLTDEAIAVLAERGYEPENGSRPLRGVIEREVEDRLADLLLRGKVARGDAIEFAVRPDGSLGVRQAEEASRKGR